MTDQIIRSSRGPTSHIAEGYGRFHERDNARFCRMARGSLYETRDHLITACDDGFIDQGTFDEVMALSETALRTVSAYIAYLENRASAGGAVAEPQAPYGSAVTPVQDPPSPDDPLDADI